MAATGLPDAENWRSSNRCAARSRTGVHRGLPEPGHRRQRHDPRPAAQAYQLLQEAGWKIVDDKMVDATANR
jgi:microcin C transport system substrate-binding protein